MLSSNMIASQGPDRGHGQHYVRVSHHLRDAFATQENANINLLRADATRRYTQDGLRHFESDPAFYDHSLANFRLTALGTMLGKGLGIRYNYDRIHNPDHSNSQDIFIHGLLTGQRSYLVANQ